MGAMPEPEAGDSLPGIGLGPSQPSPRGQTGQSSGPGQGAPGPMPRLGAGKEALLGPLGPPPKAALGSGPGGRPSAPTPFRVAGEGTGPHGARGGGGPRVRPGQCGPSDGQQRTSFSGGAHETGPQWTVSEGGWHISER